MKKILRWLSVTLICFSLIVISAGVILFLFFGSTRIDDQSKCPFCNQKIIDNQKIYEDDLVFVLYTHKPIFPGHCLILPKRHVERFEQLSDIEMMHIGQIIRKVNVAVQKVFGTSPYLLHQKNGWEVGQSVPHVHFHYIPRLENDGSTIKFVVNMCMAGLKGPIKPNETQEIVEKLRNAWD